MIPDALVSDKEWIASRFDSLPIAIDSKSPSQIAESVRYLPQSSGPFPGLFDYAVTPYLREIVDCFDVESQISYVYLKKGVQIGATTAVLENILLYAIVHLAASPVMLLTADAELARNRLELNIIPMLQQSGLAHLLKSADEGNNRKTGKTLRRLQWEGGGFALPFGARNAAKMRQTPIRILLGDEVDGWPLTVGKDGDPWKLCLDRTRAYESGGRKVLGLSTPTIKGQSKISELYLLGDQRKYFVSCLKCGFRQELRWRRQDPATGEISGFIWETDGGMLVPGSTRYLCESCGHPHCNEDKARLLAPENGAEWRPTAVPVAPDVRSYHLPALYSPPQMQSWDACSRDWLEAWDVERNRSRDNAKLQVFYNNILAEDFELRGERLRFANVSPHRRSAYSFGGIPNKWAEQFCGSTVLFLTCTVDVHAEELPVAVHGWCRDRRSFLVDYWRLKGDTEQLDDVGTWKRLEEILEQKVYVADDGKRYKLLIALIDSGYRAETVYRFCAQYPKAHVYPIKGREAPTKGATAREFSEFVPAPGQRGYHIVVDWYKDQLSAMLRRQWDGMSMQPSPFFNAPVDATDKQLKELTVEVKRERIEKSTGKRVGFEWHRPSGAANELWDLTCYASCAHDIVAAGYSKELGLGFTNFQAFYQAASRGLFFANG
jgi:phage terminase large subunit GpA-like protein